MLLILYYKKLYKEKQTLDRREIQGNYVNYLEERYNISVENNWMPIWDYETPNEYIFVLKDIIESDGIVRYFPVEADKFIEMKFGRGAGSIKYDLTEVTNWIFENRRLSHINLKIVEELQGAIEKMISEQIKKHKEVVEDGKERKATEQSV